jgi:diaminohydroxyphosphoribosylaminopyrimidine deaminase/5-amino-6-(5-phosphoribosylamino)uracil reductase
MEYTTRKLSLSNKPAKPRGALPLTPVGALPYTGCMPPCAKALIDAGVGQVVTSMEDPNSLVSGRGIAMLTQAGIPVEVGLLRDDP